MFSTCDTCWKKSVSMQQHFEQLLRKQIRVELKSAGNFVAKTVLVESANQFSLEELCKTQFVLKYFSKPYRPSDPLEKKITITICQSCRYLEAGDTQSLKFKWRGRDSNLGPLVPQTKSLTIRPPVLPIEFERIKSDLNLIKVMLFLEFFTTSTMACCLHFSCLA